MGRNIATDAELWPGASTLRWDDDRLARAVVYELGPLSLRQVGMCLGIGRERVRQIEEEALSKLQRLLLIEQRLGIARAERYVDRIHARGGTGEYQQRQRVVKAAKNRRVANVTKVTKAAAHPL